MRENEFFPYQSPVLMTTALEGKTLTRCYVDDSGMNNNLIFEFTDGTKLFIEYDWLYNWEVQVKEPV